MVLRASFAAGDGAHRDAPEGRVLGRRMLVGDAARVLLVESNGTEWSGGRRTRRQEQRRRDEQAEPDSPSHRGTVTDGSLADGFGSVTAA
jgi:hypothetical protein